MHSAVHIPVVDILNVKAGWILHMIVVGILGRVLDMTAADILNVKVGWVLHMTTVHILNVKFDWFLEKIRCDRRIRHWKIACFFIALTVTLTWVTKLSWCIALCVTFKKETLLWYIYWLSESLQHTKETDKSLMRLTGPVAMLKLLWTTHI